MGLQLVQGPQSEPVSLAEAKKHLNVTHSDDDAYIGALITAARMHLDGKDGVLGRALVTQTWDLVLDRFPDHIRIPLPPLQQVVSVSYLDADGAAQTLAEDTYAVDAVSEPGWIVPSVNGWPETGEYINAVTVRFVAGYTTVPESIKVAMQLMIGHWYANREDVVTGVSVSKVPNTSEMLLAPYRVYL